MRTVVVSTHLDDAVFSCWSVIRDQTRIVDVVAVFTQAVPHRRGAWDAMLDPTIDSLARATERRAEDIAALGHAGRTPIHLPFFDQQFGSTDPNMIVEALCGLVEAADLVYAPLAIANEEHVAVRDSVLRLRRRPIFYVDYPYALRTAVSPVRPPAGLLDAYREESVELPTETAHEKVVAANEYRGELVRLERAGFGRFATVDGLGRETFFVPEPLD